MPLPIDISPVPTPSSAHHSSPSQQLSDMEQRAQIASGREINDRRAAIENAEALRRARAL